MQTPTIHSPYPVSEMKPSPVRLGIGFAMAVGLGTILLSVLGKKSDTGTSTASVAQRRRHALAGRH